jgi:hypothetical protein
VVADDDVLLLDAVLEVADVLVVTDDEVLVLDVVTLVLLLVVDVVLAVLVVDTDGWVVDGCTVELDDTVDEVEVVLVVGVAVLEVVLVLVDVDVLLVVVGRTGHDSPAGSGSQRNWNVSLSFGFFTDSVTLPLPVLFCFLPLSDTRNGTSPDTNPGWPPGTSSSLTRLSFTPLAFAFAFTFLNVRLAGSQVGWPCFCRKRPMANSQTPFWMPS